MQYCNVGGAERGTVGKESKGKTDPENDRDVENCSSYFGTVNGEFTRETEIHNLEEQESLIQAMSGSRFASRSAGLPVLVQCSQNLAHIHFCFPGKNTT